MRYLAIFILMITLGVVSPVLADTSTDISRLERQNEAQQLIIERLRANVNHLYELDRDTRRRVDKIDQRLIYENYENLTKLLDIIKQAIYRLVERIENLERKSNDDETE